MDLDKIALIHMATMHGKMSPALYGIPLDRVEEFLEQPETSGMGRGGPWFLCFNTIDSYLEAFKNVKYVQYIEDTGRQDDVLDRLNIPKYEIKEIIEAMGKIPKLKGSKK